MFQAKLNDTVATGVHPDADPANSFSYVPDTTRRFINVEEIYGYGGRLTWQASARNKVAGFFDNRWTHWPTAFPAAGNNPMSTAFHFIPRQLNTGVKWTRPHSNGLLLEAGGSVFIFHLNNDTRDPATPWAASRGSVFQTSGLPVSTADIMPILNLSLNAPVGQFVGNQPENATKSVSDSYTGNFSATYVRGSHTVKAGGSVLFGRTLALGRRVGDATLRITNVTTGGVVTGQQAASITASLPNNTVNEINGDWGFYVQDQWSLHRLSIKTSPAF